MTHVVHQLYETDCSRWDDYVNRADSSTFFHLSGWAKVLKRAFGHTTYFLFSEKAGRIEGVLPLAHVKSRLFGSNLTSTPFCVYGGIVADNEEAASSLREAACRLAEQLNVDALELRNTKSSEPGWPTKDLYSTFRKEMDSDHDVNMKAIPAKQRAMVRKGINAGLISEPDEGSDRIYRVYSESLRNLGTPVFSRKYFRILRAEFGDDCKVLMIQHEGQDIAGVMSFYFKDEVLPYYGGSLAIARNIKGVNDFMYWELMRRSVDEGLRIFDFGRSKNDTGAFKFKKNWGFEPAPLYYQYYLVKSTEIPEVNPMNPKYQFFIKSWKKLPVCISNRVGPFLAKSLG